MITYKILNFEFEYNNQRKNKISKKWNANQVLSIVTAIEIVSVSILSQDHDSAILKRIQSRSKKIFKLVYPKKYDFKYIPRKLIAY